jgi:hypothetical protein
MHAEISWKKPEWERSLERFRRPYKDNIKMNLE